MGFLACLCPCPQDEDGDNKEGEQFRINRQVASGEGRCYGLLYCLYVSFFCLRCSIYFVWLGNTRPSVLGSGANLFLVCEALWPGYSGTMLPVKMNMFLLSEGRLILAEENKIKSTDS